MLSEPHEETFGPGTDVVVSLLGVVLVGAVLASAFVARQKILEHAAAEPSPPPKLQEDADLVLVLNTLQDGKEWFQMGSAELSSERKAAFIKRFGPHHEAFSNAKGKTIVHVTGLASAEPFGVGMDNMNLALQRASAIAQLIHDNYDMPFECMRIHGSGRGDAEVLHAQAEASPDLSLAEWDRRYQVARQKERATYAGDWSGDYFLGKTPLSSGKHPDFPQSFSSDRKIVIQTARASTRVCEFAMRDGHARGAEP